MYILNIELFRVDQSGSECVFHGFMGCIDIELSEDVLTVRVDGMNGGVALCRYLLRRLALCDSCQDSKLGSRQRRCCRLLLLLILLGCDQQLRGMLTDITAAGECHFDSLAYNIKRCILENNADMLRSVDKLLNGSVVEIVTDKDPARVGEPLNNNKEIVLVGKVEKSEVDKHDDMTVCLELLNQGSLVFRW